MPSKHFQKIDAETRCHRERPETSRPELRMVFDRVDDETEIVTRLTGTYGPGHEVAGTRRRVRTWLAGAREVVVSATPETLELHVVRPA